jgi:hypothetical protein
VYWYRIIKESLSGLGLFYNFVSTTSFFRCMNHGFDSGHVAVIYSDPFCPSLDLIRRCGLTRTICVRGFLAYGLRFNISSRGTECFY